MLEGNVRLPCLHKIACCTALEMLLCLEEVYSKLSNKIEIWIKPHPANPVNLQHYPLMTISLKNHYLIDLLSDVDVALSSVFTAASLDAFCADIPVMNYLDPNTLNFSPLREHSSARFVSSSEEILELLCDEHWLSTPSKVKPSDFFWLDEELPRWTNLIQSTFAEQNDPLRS
mgnify:CR=1 FL=1